MKVRYRLIRYSDDPERGEGVNIAIVALDEKDVPSYRHLGDFRPEAYRHDRLDRLALDHRTSADAWVFREWTHWLGILVGPGSGHKTWAALERLDGRYPQFVATEEEEIELSKKELGWRRPVDLLHDRLIGSPFDNQFDELITGTELEWVSELTLEAVIELPDAPPLHFDFVTKTSRKRKVEPQRLSAFKCVRTTGVSEATAIAAINDACFTFQRAYSAGILSPATAAVLTDAPESPGLAFLPAGTTVIDIFGEEAHHQVREIADIG